MRHCGGRHSDNRACIPFSEWLRSAWAGAAAALTRGSGSAQDSEWQKQTVSDVEDLTTRRESLRRKIAGFVKVVPACDVPVMARQQMTSEQNKLRIRSLVVSPSLTIPATIPALFASTTLLTSREILGRLTLMKDPFCRWISPLCPLCRGVVASILTQSRQILPRDVIQNKPNPPCCSFLIAMIY